MEIWLDGVDPDLTKWGSKLGVLHGVTTNPSIITDSGKSLEEALSLILKSHHGPTAVQVVSTKAEDIVEQAETLRDHSERIIVKIPVSQQGLKAMHSLSHLQLPIMATGILTPSQLPTLFYHFPITPFQLLLACHAGATFLAPYYSHIEKTGASSEKTIDNMLHIIETYGFEAELIAVSFSSLEQVMKCLELGAHAVSLKPALFNELIGDHPLTSSYVEKFTKAVKEGPPSRLISL